jgi:16S rRNA (adenine1518-N6/adenine1519-N6)-dimethyltransferase
MKGARMASPYTLLKAWSIRADKRLGQNFLTDRSIAEKIVAHAKISSDDVVLEIGSGLGALTIPAARLAAKVYAVEKDSRLLDLLKTELLANDIANTILMNKNILKIDIAALMDKSGKKLIVLGNLPYNISSQVLVKLIAVRSVVKRAILMFQLELAQRLMASPGGKDYGRLSVMVQYCANIQSVTRVSAQQFTPRPKVDSAVLEVNFKNSGNLSVDDEAFLFRVIKAAFGRRRKMLKNSLVGSELGIDAKGVSQALENARIESSRRAETLDVEEFLALSASLKNILLQTPSSSYNNQ